MKLHNQYNNYDDYIDHQKIKTLDLKNREIWLTKEWDYKISLFTELFEQNKDIINTCNNSLCVCARMGHEVVALQKMGINSIGIDLVPYDPYVITGDMHDPPFESETFDLVFSNSFDHSLNPEIFISEVERILKPNGYCFLIMQLQNKGDSYSENDIDSSKEVISLFQKSIPIINESLILSFKWTYNWKLIMQKQ